MKYSSDGDLVSRTQSDLAPFRLLRPRSVAELLDALDGLPGPVTFHAGGTDLFAKFRNGLHPATLVSVGGIADMKRTRVTGDYIELGAGLTHRAAITDDAVRAVPGLARAWAQIATVRIRHVGTLGGNLMARHTRYELSILLSALGAEARFAGPGRERSLPVEAIWTADLSETPFLVCVMLPRAGNPRLDYERSMRPRFTQALCRRDTALRLVVGTEYLQPWVTDLLPDSDQAGVLAGLPAGFSDPAIGRDYLIRAGTVFLRRQFQRLGADQ